MMSKEPKGQGLSLDPGGEKLRIAVIDDEQIWLKAFQRIFRKSAYDVDTYSDPQQFMKTVAQEPDRYAGIICDIKMPQMDGYQVFKALKQNKATRNIPFLIVSGVLTQDQNLSRVQGMPYVSKLDDDLRSKVYEELIEVIENWPKLKQFLRTRKVAEAKIETFFQFFINYHTYFSQILQYINEMEIACSKGDFEAIARVNAQCNRYIADLHNTCMEIIGLVQMNPKTTGFIRKVCQRGRTSLNMIQSFQFMLADQPSSNPEFRAFLAECRESLEKIIIGSEQGYNLRLAEA